MAKCIPAIFPASPSKSAEINEKYILDYCVKNNETEWYAWIVEQPSTRTKNRAALSVTSRWRYSGLMP